MDERVFIVQDRESAQFLRPDSGDVGFTTWVDQAGIFENEEAARETAAFHCSEGYIVFAFFSGAGS